MRIRAIVLKTSYWRPGTDYLKVVPDIIEKLVEDADIVTVSEKALSVARGLIIDESKIDPGFLARFLTRVWMRKIWGGPLGRITKLRKRTIKRLTNYPLIEGAAHKEVALRYGGFLQALRHFSEGGIDASNLPYSYVSLPISDASETADRLRTAIKERTDKNVTVMIVDGDATYSLRNLHLSPRRLEVKGFFHLGGFLTFVLGRSLDLSKRATPVAISGEKLNPDCALALADIANRARGSGAGRTAWDMANRFRVNVTDVTWEMLESVTHRPVVIVRRTQ